MSTRSRTLHAPPLRRCALRPLGAALAALLPLAAAADETVQRVTITGRTLQLGADVGGFGDVAASRLPMSVGTLDAARLLDAGARQVAELARFDPAVGDAYNAEGYWSILGVRGFVIDNRFNYRRDGLPINAETALPLANVERIELLKGTSGMQAGTSAPGGLVNLVVKRPDADLRSARVDAREGGGLGAALDLSQRFGASREFGLRLNLAYEHLDPHTRHARGRRHQVALAGDWRVTPGSRLEAEFETAFQRQPSVPGFSLLGDAVPDARAIDPRTNLNNQPWSQPVEFEGRTASLRWTQSLAADWRFVAHGMTQRLHTDDRIAFPFGCYDAATDVYYADRFCPDGTFDLYDFRSDNERRRSDALDLRVEGRAATGALRHTLAAGVLFTRFDARFDRQAYNFTGTGRIDAGLATEAAPDLTDENTLRDERSTELYLRDRVDLAHDWQLWAGVRHTRLARDSVRTDGSRPTSYDQSATLPWLALSHQPTPAQTVYASWGQGLETDVAPNRARYTNAGQALPAIKSRQVELGWKLRADGVGAGVALFDITRPVAADIGSCDDDGTCTRRIDGDARHRGVEVQADATLGRWDANAGAMWLDAERRGSADEAVNGLRPVNVPSRSLRFGLGWRPAAVDGLALRADAVHEGGRFVVPDHAARIGAWTRFDLGARYAQRVGATTLIWRLGVDNVGDKRAWKEAPYLYGHAWLFPLPPRTWRVSLQADL